MQKISDSKQGLDLHFGDQVGFAPGLQPALIQLVLTWCRSNPEGSVFLRSSSLEKESLDTFLCAPCVQVALSMARNIVLASTSENITKPIRRSLAERLEQERGTLESARIPAQLRFHSLCIDHSTDDKERRPLNLYESAKKQRDNLRSRDSFHAFFDAMLSDPELTKQTPLIRDIKVISSVIYELFQNTDEWATTDENWMILYKSIRGINFAYHKLEDLQTTPTETSPISTYLSSLSLQAKCDYVIELSVYDIGPGFSERIRNQHDPKIYGIDKEFQYFIKCLTKWQTKSTQSNRGIGLDYILEALSARSVPGFLAFRTGRLHICSDLVRRPYVGPKENPTHYVQDWDSDPSARESAHPRRHPRVAGARVTALIPV